jgi:hypothetical protein
MNPLVPTPRRDLLLAGATAGVLRRELRSGRSVAVHRGVHVAAGYDIGFLSRLHAAMATQAQRSAATLQTAAVLHAFRWLPAAWLDPQSVIHIAVDREDDRRHRRGIRLHRRELVDVDLTVVNGVACFTPTRTLVELARDPSVPPLVVVQVLDGALRDRRTTKLELLECLGRMPGERYVARARALVGRAREGVESPKETEIRLVLESGGIDGLDVNIEISDVDGLLLARGDLGSRRLLLWGEYDGYIPHTEREQFRGDRVGDRWLQRRGWQVMRFVDEDCRRGPQICQEWRQAIAEAPARIAAMPPTKSPEVAEARRLLGLR